MCLCLGSVLFLPSLTPSLLAFLNHFLRNADWTDRQTDRNFVFVWAFHFFLFRYVERASN